MRQMYYIVLCCLLIFTTHSSSTFSNHFSSEILDASNTYVTRTYFNPVQTRMSDQRKYTPNDHNFYIMQLDTGLFVDGKHKGNV